MWLSSSIFNKKLVDIITWLENEDWGIDLTKVAGDDMTWVGQKVGYARVVYQPILPLWRRIIYLDIWYLGRWK